MSAGAARASSGASSRPADCPRPRPSRPWSRRPMRASAPTRTARSPTSIPRSPARPPMASASASSGRTARSTPPATGTPLHHHERLEAVRLRARLRRDRTGRRARKNRRQRHRPALQRARRDRARRGRPHQSDGQSRRHRDDEPRPGRDARRALDFSQRRPVALRRARARAGRGGARLRAREQRAQPGDRPAPAKLRADRRRPGRGARTLHAAMLAERDRQGSRRHGRDARRRRGQPADEGAA